MSRDGRGGVWVSTAALRGAVSDGVLGVLPTRVDSDGASETCVPLEQHILTSALLRVRCADARRTLHAGREAMSAANAGALDELLSTRHELATALGHASYAHCAMSHGRMETAPAAVGAALARLSERAAPTAASELRALSELSEKLAAEQGASVGGHAAARPSEGGVHAWDLPYLMERRRAEVRPHGGIMGPWRRLLRAVTAVSWCQPPTPPTAVPSACHAAAT